MPTPSTSLIEQLRRMTAEPIASDTYGNSDLSQVIARYPVPDADGRAVDEVGWLGAWDINQAAADVWEEKAAAVAANFDFAADGGNYSRSQAHTQMLAMARRYRSRRRPGALVLQAYPKPLGAVRLDGWIGNLPETDNDDIV